MAVSPEPEVKVELYSSAEADDLSWIKDKVLLCTGITDGLGLAGITKLCESESKPKHVIFMARNPKKAEGVKQEIESKGITCSVVEADSSKPHEIIRAARKIKSAHDRLDCIWNNAGIWTAAKEVQLQEDQLEMHYATNYFAMALLFRELENLLIKSAPARFVVTGSFTSWEMMKGIVDFNNLQCENGKHKMVMDQGWPYAHSKLLQHVWCKHYATLLPDGVTVNVVDPGAVSTNIEVFGALKKCSCLFACFKKVNAVRTPAVGCMSALHAIGAKDMDGKNGMYLDWGRKKVALIKRKPVPLGYYPDYQKDKPQGMKSSPTTLDPKLCKDLYDATEKIIEREQKKYNLQERATPEKS
jgi:NAD(P)-dependent dehydrogenase (short-subunit alcohol dehydrogenase family)